MLWAWLCFSGAVRIVCRIEGEGETDMKKGLKSVVSLLLLLGLVSGVFGGCGKNEEEIPSESGLSVDEGVVSDISTVENSGIDFMNNTELEEAAYFSVTSLAHSAIASGGLWELQESVAVGKNAYILLRIVNAKAEQFRSDHQNKEWTAEVEAQYRELRWNELLEVNEQGEVSKRLNLGQIMPTKMHEVESISIVGDDRFYIIGSEKIEGSRGVSAKIVVGIDGEGNVLGEPLVFQPDKEVWNREMFFGSIEVNADGVVCVWEQDMVRGEGAVYFYDDKGEYLFAIEDNSGDYEKGWRLANVLVDRGAFYAVAEYFKENRNYLLPIDVDARAFGERIDMDVDSKNTIVKDGVVFTSDVDSVRAYSLGLQQSTTLLFWKHQDVDFAPQQVAILPLSADTILAIGDVYDEDYGRVRTLFYLLFRAEVNPHANKTIIEVGGMGMTEDQWFMAAVQKFNAESETCRVRVTDYIRQLQAQGVTNYDEMDRIVESMYLSGETPDILFDRENSDLAFYASKGLFTDLNVLMDQDEMFRREDYIDLLFNIPSAGGELFYTFYTFGVGGLLTKKENLAGKDGWSLDEIEGMYDVFPEEEVMSPNSRYYFAMSSAEFVDMKEKKAYFESDYFKQILLFRKNYGASSEEAMEYSNSQLDTYHSSFYAERLVLRNGMFRFISEGIGSVDDWKMIWNTVGTDVTLVGSPTESGTELNFYPRNFLGIAESSEYKDAAWEFVKFMLSEQVMDGYGIPVSKELIEKEIQKHMAPLSDPGFDEALVLYPELIELIPLTEEGADVLREILQRPIVLGGSDPFIDAIIEEESGAYFAGQKSVDEAARIIQDRVQVYLNQMG